MSEGQTSTRSAALKKQEALLGRLNRSASNAPAATPSPAPDVAAPPVEPRDQVDDVARAQPPATTDKQSLDSSSDLVTGVPAAPTISPFARLAANRPVNARSNEGGPSGASTRGSAQTPSPVVREPAAVAPWEDEHRPAGSAYSAIEWEAARRFGPQSLEKIAELGEEAFAAHDRSTWRFHVVEYVTAKERALLYCPSSVVETEGGKFASRAVDGRVVKESTRPPVGIGSLFMLPLDGCMLLGPAAITSFDALAKPYAAVTHERPPEGDEKLYPWNVRVIRPATPPHGEMWALATLEVVLRTRDEEPETPLEESVTAAQDRPRG